MAFEHDQRFKELLREFFPEFLTLFFPTHAENLDLSQLTWLDKELFTQPPTGSVLQADLVAQVSQVAQETPPVPPTKTKPKERLLLVHVEVESGESVAELPERMFEYVAHLKTRYKLPVLPIAVYLNVGHDGVGVGEYVMEADSFETVRCRFRYVGLPALDAATHRQGENWLGVALSALMRMPAEEMPLARAEILRRLVLECEEKESRKLQLIECVERYLQLDQQQESVFTEVLKRQEYQAMRAVGLTTYEKGEQAGVLKGRLEGRQEGRQEAALAALTRVLMKRFGPLSLDVLARLEPLAVHTLEALLLEAVDAPTLEAFLTHI